MGYMPLVAFLFMHSKEVIGYNVLGDELKAKKVLIDAIDKDPKNEKLYIQLLDMEYQKQPVSVDCTLQIFTKAIASEHFTVHTKIKMSQRRLEFLEDFGSSIQELKECYDEHQKLLKDVHVSEKKRKSSVEWNAEEPVDKKVKTNGSGDTSTDYTAYWAQYQNSGYQYPASGTWPAYGAQFYS